MNLRFVEAFHWAVTLKNVTRAAEKMHLTQSALSSRIAALERDLGVLLLDRRGGTCGVNRVERADGTVETLSHLAQVEMQAGDVFVIETPGGGGYGPAP